MIIKAIEFNENLDIAVVAYINKAATNAELDKTSTIQTLSIVTDEANMAASIDKFAECLNTLVLLNYVKGLLCAPFQFELAPICADCGEIKALCNSIPHVIQYHNGI